MPRHFAITGDRSHSFEPETTALKAETALPCREPAELELEVEETEESDEAVEERPFE
jgi:hypothetical protein